MMNARLAMHVVMMVVVNVVDVVVDMLLLLLLLQDGQSCRHLAPGRCNGGRRGQ